MNLNFSPEWLRPDLSTVQFPEEPSLRSTRIEIPARTSYPIPEGFLMLDDAEIIQPGDIVWTATSIGDDKPSGFRFLTVSEDDYLNGKPASSAVCACRNIYRDAGGDRLVSPAFYAAAMRVVDAWIIEGRAPLVHAKAKNHLRANWRAKAKNHLRANWRTLANAVDDLSKLSGVKR